MARRSTAPQRTTRSEKLDLRLTEKDKRLLQKAAEVERRSVSDFVVHSALARAEETLLDRRAFYVDARTYDRFIAALDAPPRDHARLRQLLNEPSVFDRDKTR